MYTYQDVQFIIYNQHDASDPVDLLIMSALCILDEVIRYTAITWLKEFVQLSGRTMLPFTSGILTAVLPCLSYDDLTFKGKKSQFLYSTKCPFHSIETYTVCDGIIKGQDFCLGRMV